MPKRQYDSGGEWLTARQVMRRLLKEPVFRGGQITCVIPAVRRGKEWRFSKTDLDEWISRRKRLEQAF
jgi:hypothetical protein